MANAELERISAYLNQAHSPEEIFGTLTGTQAEMLEVARRVFRQMAKAVHPDLYEGTTDFEQAGSAFKKLTQFWEQARVRIENGIYGTSDTIETFKPFTICTRQRQYTVERLLTHGDLCGLYIGRGVPSGLPTDKKSGEILKVPIKPEDNDLMANEARILSHLRASEDYESLRHFVSQLIDSFSYLEEATGIVRRVNVISYIEGLYSLEEVREAYPEGVDPRDMAWIWRRVLIALGFAHANKVIHGCVIPPHIMIHPEEHGVVLVDWSYAVFDPEVTEERISAISSPYRIWYPAEVFAKEVPTPGLDICMAAMCMIDLLGGDPHKRTMPETVPSRIQNYLKGCTLPNPHRRPQDAHKLLEAFDELIEQLWGPRTFHKFTMPEREMGS
jgi:serine/threonine protein kinase